MAHRKMMGEYPQYSNGILLGGIYDDRLLLKDTPSARKAFPAERIPYDSAKSMLLVDSEDPALIATVIELILPVLPRSKRGAELP